MPAGVATAEAGLVVDSVLTSVMNDRCDRYVAAGVGAGVAKLGTQPRDSARN